MIFSRLGHLRPIPAILGLTLLMACGQPNSPVTQSEFHDPHERTNRSIHEFNRSLDRALIRPTGKGYSSIVPDDIETVIGRFAFNLSIPSAVVNSILQGNMRGAIQDLSLIHI